MTQENMSQSVPKTKKDSKFTESLFLFFDSLLAMV